MPRGDAASGRRPAWFAAARRFVDASPEGFARAWDRLLKWAVAPASTKMALFPPPADGFALAASGPTSGARPGRIVWEGVEYRGRIGWIPAGSSSGAVQEGWSPPPLDSSRRDQDWALWLAAAPIPAEVLRRTSAATPDPRVFLWSPAPPAARDVDLLLDFAAWQTIFRENASAVSPRRRARLAEADRCFREGAWRFQKLVDDGFARGLWMGGGGAEVQAAPRFGRLSARIAERFGEAVGSRFPKSVRLSTAEGPPFDDAAAVRLMNGWIRLGESASEAVGGRVAEDVDRFGRFLELSAPDSPRRLSLASSPTLNRLRKWLSDRPPGATPLLEVHRRFVGFGEGDETCGLTRRRVDLYLCCLARSGEAVLHFGGAETLDAAALGKTAVTAVLLESIRGVEWIPPERRAESSVDPLGAGVEATASAAVPPYPTGSSPADDEALRIFVESHRRPESDVSDDYKITPFNEQLVDAERSAVFQMHPYWSKKPHGAIRRYIEHFTRPGDLVLDPFTGSGGVNSVASGLGRPSVGIDLSPAAVFIAKHLCTPHPIPEIETLYRRMKDDLASVRAQLYGSTCHRCGGPAETRYVVWSQRYRCSQCAACVRHDAFHAVFTGPNASSAACPHCGGAITTRAERLGYTPVETSLLCQGSCSGGMRQLFRSASGTEDEVKAFQRFDVARIDSLKKEDIPYWHPEEKFSGDWVSWRPNLAEAGDVSGFFTVRNLWAAAAVRDWISRHEAEPAASWLLFSLTASLMSISKKAQHLEEGGGYIPGNYVFPPRIKERNVFATLENLFKKTLRGVEEINARESPAAVHLSARTARDLGGVPDDSIDYVFTDPPYSDKVPFGEFNFLWEVWLRAEVSWNRDEILVNPKLGKGLREWRSMLRDVARELFRVLKPGRWVSVCYHDDSAGAWTHLQQAFTEVGFILEYDERTLSIERGRKSWKQATTLKSQKRDLVVNFRKPRLGEAPSSVESTPRRPFREEAAELLLEMLRRKPGRPADRLYDEFVSRLVRRRRLERHDFHRLLAELAESWEGRLYARGAEVFMDAAGRTKEEAAMRRLESQAWKGKPRAGVSTARMLEWAADAPLEDRPARPLEEILPEYFIRSADGTWRRPRKAERAALESLRAAGSLVRLRRFTAGLLSERPLASADCPSDAAELLSWLRFASSAGWKERAVALFVLGGFEMTELSESDRAAAEAAYRGCRARTT